MTCPVAPASAMAMSTATFILDVLKMVSALFEVFMSKVSKVVCQDLCLGAIGMVVVHIGGSSLSTEESSVSHAVAVVSSLSEQLIRTMVTSTLILL